MANPLSGKAALTAVACAQGLAALAILRFGADGPIPMHFNISGQVDRWGDRGEVALVTAITAAATLGGGLALDVLVRRRDAEDRSNIATVRGVLMLVTSLACGLMLALAFRLLGAPSDAGAALMAILGGVLAATGAYIGKVGPNPIVGVRTPWTFASRLAWDKANRLGGRLLFWGGLIALAAAPFAPQPAGFRAVIGGSLLIAVVVVFESWRVWRTDPDRRSAF